MRDFEIYFIIYSLINEFCSIYALYGISTSLCKCPSASLLFNITVTKDPGDIFPKKKKNTA